MSGPSQPCASVYPGSEEEKFLVSRGWWRGYSVDDGKTLVMLKPHGDQSYKDDLDDLYGRGKW